MRGLILGDAYGAENFAREPDGVGNRRVMLVRFAQAAAHRLHRLSGREVVTTADALDVGIEVIINSEINLCIYMTILMH